MINILNNKYLHTSSSICMEILPHVKDMHRRLIGEYNLPIVVHVKGCLSLYVSAQTDWWPVQTVPHLLGLAPAFLVTHTG